MIRSLIGGGALSDILLFIVNSMSWILRVSMDGSLILCKRSWWDALLSLKIYLKALSLLATALLSYLNGKDALQIIIIIIIIIIIHHHHHHHRSSSSSRSPSSSLPLSSPLSLILPWLAKISTKINSLPHGTQKCASYDTFELSIFISSSSQGISIFKGLSNIAPILSRTLGHWVVGTR